jgi:hypothetical protein
MKRVLATALIVSAFSGFGLVGCTEEAAKVEHQDTVKTPEGSTTTTTTSKVETSGDNPPAPATGDATKK